jgi:hypothetical protein
VKLPPTVPYPLKVVITPSAEAAIEVARKSAVPNATSTCGALVNSIGDPGVTD